MKGQLPSGVHSVYTVNLHALSTMVSTQCGFCWQFMFITSEVVILETQAMSNIYFYLTLLGGLLDSTPLLVFGKRFYSLSLWYAEKDLYYKYILTCYYCRVSFALI